MFVLWFVNILNFLLDPVLIFGLFGLPKMGVRGSATATVICQFLGVLVQLAVILSGRGRIRVAREKAGPRKAILGSLVKLGLPASFQIFVRTISFLMIMRVVAFYGTLALAGYGIAVRLFLFILMPGFGMGNAVATLVGQNLGAGKPERSERSAWLATGYNLLVMGTLSLTTFALAEPTVAIFNADPGVVAFGSQALRIITPSYLLTAVGIVMMRSLMGAGDTLTPMLINLVTLWGFLIPAAYLSWWSGWGPNGVFWSVAAANGFNALLALAWFRRGRWTYIRV
jgi:putative MATE family efflux protein